MFQFEGYTLDSARNALRTADRDLKLRPKSFEVLCYLLENADRIVSKKELMKAVWPDVIVTDQVLTHCVSEVRQALGDSKQTIIATVPRRRRNPHCQPQSRRRPGPIRARDRTRHLWSAPPSRFFP